MMPSTKIGENVKLSCLNNIATRAKNRNSLNDITPTGVTGLFPKARHINPSLVLVQHRKARHDITEKNQVKMKILLA